MKTIWITLGTLAAVLVTRAGYHHVNANARKEEMMKDQRVAIALEKATFGAG